MAAIRTVGVLGLALASLLAPVARAQTAPAGNAHPTTDRVSHADAANPFGTPDWSGVMAYDESEAAEARRAAAARAKHELARGVDLTPLGDLAVFHAGRVKVLETLARETVSSITGRRNFTEFVPGEGAGFRAVQLSYDPLFTFLDLLIDPGYYFDRPLIHVEFLPLRRELLTAAYPRNEGELRRWHTEGGTLSAEQGARNAQLHERWLRLARLAPRLVSTYAPLMQERFAFEGAYASSLGRVGEAMGLYQFSDHNLLLVAPASTDQRYTHLASLPEGSPARAAAARLAKAWRAGDAAGVNAAARELGAEVRAINPATYPGFARRVEVFYNRSNAFELGLWTYLVSFLSLILAFGTGRRWLVWVGVATLLAAIGLHATGFVTRCLIAQRFAIQNQFESMTGVSLFAALVGLGMMLVRRQWLFGAASAGVGFLVLVTATQTAIPGETIEREAAILNTSVLLKYHVTTVLTSYGLISLGFIVSCFYLGTHYATRWHRPVPVMAGVGGGGAEVLAAAALGETDPARAGRARTLHELDVAQMTILQLAFWTLGVGLMLGAWWADHSWGRWWAFDPKETWALVTWIIYLIVIHVRFTTGHNRGLVTAWLSVLGFVVMLWTYFGVNLLLPGLHAYA